MGRIRIPKAGGTGYVVAMAPSRLKRGLRATLTGLVVNVVLATVKLAGGILGHSHALVADAVESFADVCSSLVVWRGLVVASEPADEDHPYGHGKAEPIATAVVATMLLGAAVWIALTAVREIQSPHRAPAAFTLAVLVVVIAVKETLFRFVLRESASIESTAMKSDAWHHRSDAITSLAAFLGISVAVVGGEGYASADDWAALLAGAIIAWNGWRLLRPALNELMDQSPTTGIVEEIRRIADSHGGIDGVETCHVRKMGYHYYVDMHLQVAPEMSVRESHQIAHEVKDRIRQRLPSVRDVLIHIEPSRS